MEFRPFRAGLVFALGVVVPPAFVIAATGAKSLGLWFLIILTVPLWALLFGLGAKLSPDPHRLKSVVTSILATWTFFWSTNGLVNEIFEERGLWLNVAVITIQFVFVFGVGWRLAPRRRTVDDWDKSASSAVGAAPRRSTSSLDTRNF